VGKQKLFLLTTIFIIFLLTQCGKKEQQTAGPKILTGWLTESHLLKEMPAYQEGKDSYEPDDTVIGDLNILDQNFHVLIFLGTYCPDCKREVPRFLKIVDLLENKNVSYKLFGLNRAKDDTSDMRKKYNVEYVPTFIVYFNEQEIGRIIESPMVSIENDLLEICSMALQVD